MDSLVAAAARALAAGDPLGALKRVALRDDPPALALRGIAMARPVRLDEVEDLFASGELVIDACRRVVRGPKRSVSLAGRPILFSLVVALAEAWPEDVARDRLIEQTFRARVANESHRARLRVEMSRLRAALRQIARIEATPRGFSLAPMDAAAVAVLAPPIDSEAGAILALLEDGESWSTSALASALGSSQRTVQRELRQLEEAAAVRAIGQGRSRRWLAPPIAGFATNLLLPGALPVG